MTPVQRKLVILLLAFMIFFICVWPTIDLQNTELRAEGLVAMAFALLLWAGTTVLRAGAIVFVPREPCPAEEPSPRGLPDPLLRTSCRLC